MDPKSIANLDPKLRETYERVMGTSGAPTAAPATPSENQPAPMSPAPAASNLSASPASPVTPPPDLSAPVSPEPQLSSSLSAPTGSDALGASIPSSTPYSPADLGLSQPAAGGAATVQPLSSPATVAQATQGSSSLVKLLYIFGGIIFFVVYVFFWIKIFNYQLPF